MSQDSSPDFPTPNHLFELRSACSTNDLSSITTFLSTNPINAPPQQIDHIILELLTTATTTGQSNTISHLLPLLSSNPYKFPRKLIVQAIEAGKEIYKLYLDNNPAILEYQWRWGNGVTGAITWEACESPDMLRFMLEQGADPGRDQLGVRYFYRYLPIEVCCMCSYVSEEKLRLLIEYGALVKGTYALQLAAVTGRLECVRILLEAGADVDGLADGEIEIEEADGRRRVLDMDWHPGSETALQLAADAGKLEVVECLLKAGANILRYRLRNES